ncbi:Gfo/Idh/MocA family protein [Gallaecimonas pentaromativorans]|uniref:Putative dehydrogenase n=1 Tax=Gallaecimonas pentaromativorans TaxID=584787 RepID=A0A3N1P5N1_9GAMM|nr:Gfo/Idh/MocA family oxidoreductase [Gallaecimonas pentaromativorans]ROQ22447.1 putative dehydrogenase [Gallaecimonas pentaromativorans]
MSLRIGILGAAAIAPQAIIEPARLLGVTIQAVAASHEAKAEAYARQHGIQNVSPSYQALVEREDIDLIYNALPPSLHGPWTLKALDAGKAVLCEKPFAMNATEAAAMVAAAKARGLLLMEAFHYRFHPFFIELERLLAEGVVGRVHTLRANFEAQIPYRADSLRHNRALGGGALMDLGCYPVHWLRTLMGSEPEVAQAQAISNGQVDVATQAKLAFTGGVTGYIGCAMGEHLKKGGDSHISIEGERGLIEAINPISPQRHHLFRIHGAEGCRQYSIDTRQSTFYYQLAHVKACLEDGRAPLTGGRDAIANMAVIDQIKVLSSPPSPGAAIGKPH